VCAAFLPFDGDEEFGQLRRILTADAGETPLDLAVILGSGWGHLVEMGHLVAESSYRQWSWFPEHLISGHAGRMAVIAVQNRRILCFAGRFHCYQGLSAFDAALPVRVAAALGCPKILLTCAAGGINPRYETGDFAWITDHLNLLGDNPLRGVHEEPFIDLSGIYNEALFRPLLEEANKKGITLHAGVLAAMAGPSYETPAEIRMLKRLGADLASMSMAHEAIMAAYLGLEVAGLALVSNRAAGLDKNALCHEKVLACAEASKAGAQALFADLLDHWGKA